MTPPRPSPAALLDLRGLHKRFGDNVVLDGLDLDLGRAESLAVIGTSGAGKSVILKCILGLLNPDAGVIRLEGRDVRSGSGRDEIRRRTGMLFQHGALFDSLSVWENVAFRLLQNHRTSRRDARDFAVEIMARVGLDADTGALNPAALSGGMQKRVALARAIAAKPDILFLDEPTTGLDPITASIINELIAETVATSGVSTLSISHDMSSVRRIATRAAMLHGGRIIWSGDIAAMEHSGNPCVDQFIHGRAQGPIRTAAG